MLKFSAVFLILLFSVLLTANVVPPVIEYVKYDGGISDVPESIENSNTIYRDADNDVEFDTYKETVIYRATLEGDEITDVVQFELDEENKTYYSSFYHFVFSDHCVEPGKYLYISDLDCSKFINDYYSLDCRNYVEVEFDEPTNNSLCDPEKYENIELTDNQIEELKSEMFGEGPSMDIEEGDLYFISEVGEEQDQQITIKNISNKFKADLLFYSDSYPIEPFYVILTDEEGSCRDGLSLLPQESCKLYIRFAPELVGDYEDYFWIQNDFIYYSHIKLTGYCEEKSNDESPNESDDIDSEADEENLNSDDDSEINDEQVYSESPDDVAESNDNSGELETNDDAVIGENSSDGCSVIVL